MRESVTYKNRVFYKDEHKAYDFIKKIITRKYFDNILQKCIIDKLHNIEKDIKKGYVITAYDNDKIFLDDIDITEHWPEVNLMLK